MPNYHPNDSKPIDLSVYRDALAKCTDSHVAVAPDVLINLIDSIIELQHATGMLEDDIAGLREEKI